MKKNVWQEPVTIHTWKMFIFSYNPGNNLKSTQDYAVTSPEWCVWACAPPDCVTEVDTAEGWCCYWDPDVSDAVRGSWDLSDERWEDVRQPTCQSNSDKHKQSRQGRRRWIQKNELISDLFIYCVVCPIRIFTH